MTASISFKKRSNRLLKSLLGTIEDFRKANDHQALESLLNSIIDLENLLTYQQYVGDIDKKIDKFLPIFQNLHDCVKNQDVIGMVDILEFELYPLSKEWIEGWGEE